MLRRAPPPSQSGGANGIVATARLPAQTTGAARAATCFGLSDARRPALAMGLGCVFAGVATVVSFLRTTMRPDAAGDSSENAT